MKKELRGQVFSAILTSDVTEKLLYFLHTADDTDEDVFDKVADWCHTLATAIFMGTLEFNNLMRLTIAITKRKTFHTIRRGISFILHALNQPRNIEFLNGPNSNGTKEGLIL